MVVYIDGLGQYTTQAHATSAAGAVSALLAGSSLDSFAANDSAWPSKSDLKVLMLVPMDGLPGAYAATVGHAGKYASLNIIATATEP
jgi:hypothetical protein